MKYIQFTPGTMEPAALEAKLKAKFEPKFKVSSAKHNPKEITVAEDKAVGCKVIVMKKRLMINGTFATPSRMMIAMLVLLIGGILIPMILYLTIFKPRFQAVEKEVYDYLMTELAV